MALLDQDLHQFLLILNLEGFFARSFFVLYASGEPDSTLTREKVDHEKSILHVSPERPSAFQDIIPLLGINLPEWFQNNAEYSELLDIFLDNAAHALVTPFHLQPTLIHMLYFVNQQLSHKVRILDTFNNIEEIEVKGGNPSLIDKFSTMSPVGHAISLFIPLPITERCPDMGIQPEECPCSEEIPIDIEKIENIPVEILEFMELTALFSIQTTNKRIESGIGCDICAKMSLSSIENVSILFPLKYTVFPQRGKDNSSRINEEDLWKMINEVGNIKLDIRVHTHPSDRILEYIVGFVIDTGEVIIDWKHSGSPDPDQTEYSKCLASKKNANDFRPFCICLNYSNQWI